MLFQILYYDVASNCDLITVITEESDDEINTGIKKKRFYDR